MSSIFAEEYSLMNQTLYRLISQKLQEQRFENLKGLNTKSKSQRDLDEQRFRCKIRTVPYFNLGNGTRETRIGSDEILLYISSQLLRERETLTFSDSLSFRLIVAPQLWFCGYDEISQVQLMYKSPTWTDNLQNGDLETFVDDFLEQTDTGLSCVKKSYAYRKNHLGSYTE